MTEQIQNTVDNLNQKKNKTNKVLIAIIIILLLIILGVGGWFAWDHFNGLNYSSDQTMSYFQDKTEEEIQAELDELQAKSNMTINCASRMVVEAGTTSCTARIQNVEGNNFDQMVKIVLQDTGETLYESDGLIKPGYSIETIQLNRVLDKGSYKVDITFTGYDLTTHAEAGSVGATVDLVVE
jgi:predicted negative regulator of RcsB-dependent stress response